MITRINFRDAPALTGGRWPKAAELSGPSPSGISAGRPVKLRTFERTHRDAGERLYARFAEAKEEAVNAAAKPDDVVIAPVRAVSADLVDGHFIDQRDPAPLKAAVPLFEDVPLYTMHWADPRGWLGLFSEPTWDDALLGLHKVPGVTGHAVLEGDVSDAAKACARGVLRRSLKRWSIGFQLDLEPSHDEMSKWGWEEWWSRLGAFDDDGKQYLLVLKAVVDVYELSLVDIGAIESARTTDALDHRKPAASLRALTAPDNQKPARLRGSHVAPSVRRLTEIAR